MDVTAALGSRPRDASECTHLKRTTRRHRSCGLDGGQRYVTSFIGEGPAPYGCSDRQAKPGLDRGRQPHEIMEPIKMKNRIT